MAVKKIFKSKRLTAIVLVFLFFLLVWLFLSYNVNPIIKRMSEQKIKEITTIAINNATQSVVMESALEYSKIVNIDKNNQGEIELMSVNTMLVNTISRQVASYSQTKITELGALGVEISIGSLSGLTFLAGHGPNIKIKVYPVGSVAIKFDSEFISAGINQTKHRINLLINADVSIIMPGQNRTVSTVTEIILSESIIIGKVPEVYLQSSSLNNMLDLIPD